MGATGQVAFVTPVAGAGAPLAFPIDLPSMCFPIPTPAPTGPMPLPIFAAMPPIAGNGLNGGMAIDQSNGLIYSTDGFMLAVDFHGIHGPPAGWVPLPPVAVVGMVLPNQPITGLGFDTTPFGPAGGRILMSSAGGFRYFSSLWPYAPIGPPVATPWVAAQIVGIDWDPATASVFIADVVGNIYNCTAAGVPLGPQPISFSPLPGPIGALALTGLCVNRTNGPGSFPPPLGSPQIPGFNIVVTNGFVIADAMIPGVIKPVFPTGAPGPSYGLAYSNDTQRMPGSGSPLNVAMIGTNRPAHNGLLPPILRVRLTGAPPNQTAILAYDIACFGVGAFPMPWGGALCINPATLAFIVHATDPTGTADIPIPAGALAGVQVCTVWVYGDPLNPPFFISHTDCMNLTIGLL